MSMGDASVVNNQPLPNMQDPNMMSNPQDMGTMGEEPVDMNNMPMDDMDSVEPNPDREREQIQKNIGKACADFRNGLKEC